jgi:hypothetical protein
VESMYQHLGFHLPHYALTEVKLPSLRGPEKDESTGLFTSFI